MRKEDFRVVTTPYVEVVVRRGVGSGLLLELEPNRPDIVGFFTEILRERRGESTENSEHVLMPGCQHGTFRIFRDGTVQCDPEVRHDFVVALARRWRRSREELDRRNGTSG